MTKFIVCALVILSVAGRCWAKEPNAIALFQAGHLSAAKTLFETMEDKSISNFYLGQIAFMQKQFDAAGVYFEEALERDPDNADLLYWLGRVKLQKASNASIFTAPSYVSAAKAYLLQALTVAPDHLGALQSLISYYIHVPRIAGGSIPTALEYADRLFQVDEAEALIAKLAIYHEADNPQRELQLAGIILSDYPASGRALLKAGFVFQLYGEYVDAFECFTRAASISSNPREKVDVAALYQMGKTAVLSHAHTEVGIESLEQYLALDIDDSLPGKDWAKYRLATLHFQQQNTQRALVVASEALDQTQDRKLKRNLQELVTKLDGRAIKRVYF